MSQSREISQFQQGYLRPELRRRRSLRLASRPRFPCRTCCHFPIQGRPRLARCRIHRRGRSGRPRTTGSLRTSFRSRLCIDPRIPESRHTHLGLLTSASIRRQRSPRPNRDPVGSWVEMRPLPHQLGQLLSAIQPQPRRQESPASEDAASHHVSCHCSLRPHITPGAAQVPIIASLVSSQPPFPFPRFAASSTAAR